MADGVAITAGSGTTILTDDTGVGGHAQVMKLAISTDGSGTLIPADATNGIKVDVARIAAGTNNIGDVDVLTLPALPAGTNVVGQVNVAPQTSGGLTVYHLVSAATTNATVVKASAGQLYGYYLYNSNASARKVAFHNTALAPTAGASIYFTVVVPGSSAANVEFTNGLVFSTGIAITTVTDLTDAGTTAVALNDLNINLFYK